jgi:hypothetical protein
MLDPEAHLMPILWDTPRETRQPERTLCESRISAFFEARVAAFAQSKLSKQLERVDWDKVLVVLVMFSSFMAGMATCAYVQFAKVLSGGCR